jgi:U3 small nucleolar RNA-associated protein MPP10
VEISGSFLLAEPMYGDFFDPPPGMSTRKSPVRAKAGKVRFHEEVKVKKIKPKGRGLPVNTPVFWEEEVDDEEEFEGFGDEDGMVNDHMDVDQDYEEDEEDEDDDEDDEEFDVDDDEEDDDEDSEGDDQEIGQTGRQAIERLKDDLFAEEDSEEEPEEGESHGVDCGLLLNSVCRPHESPEAHGSFEGADHSHGGRKRRS